MLIYFYKKKIMKNIPKYDIIDIQTAGKDGNFNIEIFSDFIFQLLQQKEELSYEERKLIKDVDSKGTMILNDVQMFFLEKIVTRYERNCEICQEKIPLNEIFHLGKYCSNHAYLNDED